LSSESFFKQTLLLKKEKANLGYEKTSLSYWLKQSLLFKLAHSCHTEYAKTYFQPGKEANLESIEMKIIKAEEHPKPKSGSKKKGRIEA